MICLHLHLQTLTQFYYSAAVMATHS